MKRYEEQSNLDKDLKKLRNNRLTQGESLESYHIILSRLNQKDKQEKKPLSYSRLTVTLATIIVLISVSWIIFSQQQHLATSISNQMDGIELELTIDKSTYSLDDNFVATITITNHNGTAKEIYVPVPIDIEAGISAVMVEKRGQMLYQLLTPQSNQEHSNLKGRSFYDYALVKIGPHETIKQDFQWDMKLIKQENRKVIAADRGEYTLSSFIVLDELHQQLEYYEPENQLISKLTFRITDDTPESDVYTSANCPEGYIPCVNAIAGSSAVKVFNGTSTLNREDGSMMMGDFFQGDIEKNLDTLKVNKSDMVTLEFINHDPNKLSVYMLEKEEKVKKVNIKQNAFTAPDKSGTYIYEIVGEYAHGIVNHYVKVRVK
ncbi:hypothetical protein [Ornithinibacillus scapharcae]|uniref:hypothetical protein n=1 Tax=Ornithinibacillus scapharcae TaxID=1147159 RepID=UPI000225BA5F|nr:hypothetical protein [Ornithinibacillus scapharcae]